MNLCIGCKSFRTNIYPRNVDNVSSKDLKQ
jgi:hypothetical protein